MLSIINKNGFIAATVLAVILFLYFSAQNPELRLTSWGQFPTAANCKPFAYNYNYNTNIDNHASGTSFMEVGISGVTGKVFQGVKIANYTGPRLFTTTSVSSTTSSKRSLRPTSDASDAAATSNPKEVIIIKKWAVVTTIHVLSDAILQFTRQSEWGLVIVGDKGAKPFVISDKQNKKQNGESTIQNTTGLLSNIIYLDVVNQEELATEMAGSGENEGRFIKAAQFAKLLPWKHFGRKNFGYLYAIMQGAEQIWDFDDDNPLKPSFLSTGPMVPKGDDLYTVTFLQQRPQLSLVSAASSLTTSSSTSCAVFNPYPTMGAPDPGAWPRGLPLNLVRHPCNFTIDPLDTSITTMHKDNNNADTNLESSPASASKIAIFQSLADHEPDVDGIFRLTRITPFHFKTTATKAIVIPEKTFVPFNAQATLFLRPAFWGLLLPVSVHGRVSDIWRSYFIQRLLWDIGYSIAFTPPQVNQFRNPHNPLGDMKAEDDLYMKSLALVQRLLEWRGTTNTLPGRYEELIIDMYERGYVGVKDVALVQQWLLVLEQAGYNFPKLVSQNEHKSDTRRDKHGSNSAIEEKQQTQQINEMTPSLSSSSFPLYTVATSSKTDARPSTKTGGNVFVSDLSVSVVVRTYGGRMLEFWTTLVPGYLLFFPWREWLNLDMVIVLDGDLPGDHYAGVLMGNLPPYPKIVFEEFPPEGTLVNWGGRGIGYCRQQYSNFYADLQTDADVIAFVDTDTLFVSPVTPEYLFQDGKPIQVGVQVGLPDDDDWTVGVRIALGTPRPFVRMMVSAFPVMIKRAHFPLLREHMIRITESKSFEEAFYKAATGNKASSTLCQFDIIVTYLWYFHRNEYSWHLKDASINPVPYANFKLPSLDPDVRPTHHSPIMYVNKNGGHENQFLTFVSDFICLASNYSSGSCTQQREAGVLDDQFELSLINNLRIDTWLPPHAWKARGHRTKFEPFSLHPKSIGDEDNVWETPREHWTTTWNRHVQQYTSFKDHTKSFQWASFSGHSIEPWNGEAVGSKLPGQRRSLKEIDSPTYRLFKEERESEGAKNKMRDWP